MSGELVKREADNFLPVMAMETAIQRRESIILFTAGLMKEGHDYGVIPNTDKPTLLKPGAEKLCTLFGLVADFQVVEAVQDWTGSEHDGEPFFFYRIKCVLLRDGKEMGSGEGSCNSWESKYRFRWVDENKVPPNLDKSKLKTRGGKVSEFAFAINKAETSGQYGKPAEYWKRFADAIEHGDAVAIKRTTKTGKQMDAWEIDATMFCVPNENPADVVNTIDKMAQKRALVAACLVTVNASEFYTQDMEDMPDANGGYTPYEVVDQTVKGGNSDPEGYDQTAGATMPEKKPEAKPKAAAKPKLQLYGLDKLNACIADHKATGKYDLLRGIPCMGKSFNGLTLGQLSNMVLEEHQESVNETYLQMKDDDPYKETVGLYLQAIELLTKQESLPF